MLSQRNSRYTLHTTAHSASAARVRPAASVGAAFFPPSRTITSIAIRWMTRSVSVDITSVPVTLSRCITPTTTATTATSFLPAAVSRSFKVFAAISSPSFTIL